MTHRPTGAAQTEDESGTVRPTGGLEEGEEAAIESVPEAVRDAARRAFTARRPGITVADLVYDSVVDIDRRADRDAYVRRLRFGTESAGVDLAVEDGPDGLEVTLVLLPPREAEVEISGDLGGPTDPTKDSPEQDGSATDTATRTNDQGRVTLRLPEGLVSFVFRPVGATTAEAVQTAWVRL